MMKSLNFEFLRTNWPHLVSLGALAESYLHQDPSSALVKLRSFGEQAVLEIYSQLNLTLPYQANFFDMLEDDSFRHDMPKVVVDKLHALRKEGNKAAHGGTVSKGTATVALREAHDVARWLHVTFTGANPADCPSFSMPNDQPTETAKSLALAKQEKRAALRQLAEQEDAMAELMQRLQKVTAESQQARKENSQLQELIKAGVGATTALKFSEAETRKRLIDSALVDAGWDVGSDGEDTQQVGQEIEVKHQPTPTGVGYVDYVLWGDDGKPLAVVEAKKTAEDARRGKQQAMCYADGLEKQYGQRPVIFYTNGFDIFIWDDAQNYPARKLYGFYSEQSLEYLVTFQRNNRKPLDKVAHKPEIAERLYQVGAITQVKEEFSKNRRSALIVQATGTGKTRLAVSLTDVLLRAGWVKSVLFLCDRRELRKQAKNAFSEFLPEPVTILTPQTARDRNKRIFVATYPGMMKVFQSFDVGYFDLIIADESHRSIYNKYRDIFSYFDCLQIGLTATPVEFIRRNTYKMFSCEDQNPTTYYPLSKAVEDGYLVPFEVYTHTTQFLREGIKYADLTEEQKKQLEEDGEDPALYDYEKHQVDKQVHNKETNRKILRNLMEKGIRDSSGRVGKTIVFARNHKHAVLLEELFDEEYPQYGGKFCQVIDNYEPRAEQLIDDFKGQGNNPELTIAISVDMLDTGIDVPEIVNLVFAKPIKSRVKFDQMLGRGTRLCENLFGPGQHKKVCRVFDHWGNFEFFDQQVNEPEESEKKTIMQMVFEAQLRLAETAREKADEYSYNMASDLLLAGIASLPDKCIAGRDFWKTKKTVEQPAVLKEFSPATVRALREEIAPLMKWVNLRGHVAAYEFDLLIANMQTELLKGSARFEDLKGVCLDKLSRLKLHLNPVKARLADILEMQSDEYWENVTVKSLEGSRKGLRGIIKYVKGEQPGFGPRVIDISDDDEEYDGRSSGISAVDMVAYTQRVEAALKKLFDSSPVLQKIRNAEPVSEGELDTLTSLVLTQNPGVDLNTLKEFYPEMTDHLDFLIRRIVGMDAAAVRKRFEVFTVQHPSLNSKQVRFLGLLQNHIAKNGHIHLYRLYEAPFTTVDAGGPDGVFHTDELMDDLLEILSQFQPPEETSMELQ